MELGLIEIGMTLVGAFLANHSVKLWRAYPLMKKAYDQIVAEYTINKDGQITDKEAAKRYREIREDFLEGFAFLKGLFPNKSKV